ncbi:signal recognition particle receptor beta subunit protein, partial [Cystoisospora suis]
PLVCWRDLLLLFACFLRFTLRVYCGLHFAWSGPVLHLRALRDYQHAQLTTTSTVTLSCSSSGASSLSSFPLFWPRTSFEVFAPVLASATSSFLFSSHVLIMASPAAARRGPSPAVSRESATPVAQRTNTRVDEESPTAPKYATPSGGEPSWTERSWEVLVSHPATRLMHSTEGLIGPAYSIPNQAYAALILLAYSLFALLGLRVLCRWSSSSDRASVGSRGSGRRVVLLGPSGSGKTSLFLLLRNGRLTDTVPSMQENIDAVRVTASSQEGDGPDGGEEGTSVFPEIVDFPGHARLRTLSAPYVEQAAAIVFLVDAADKAALKVAAEQLYELFTNRLLHQRQTPLLLVVNKTDLSEARTEEAVVEDIEREIERSRASRAALLEGEDDADNFIGVEGEVFKILEHAPQPVEVCRASVKSSEVRPIREFLLRCFCK